MSHGLAFRAFSHCGCDPAATQTVGFQSLPGPSAPSATRKAAQIAQNALSQSDQQDKVGKNCLPKSDQQLAQEHKVTDRIIKNDATFADAVDTIAAVAPEARQAILDEGYKMENAAHADGLSFPRFSVRVARICHDLPKDDSGDLPGAQGLLGAPMRLIYATKYRSAFPVPRVRTLFCFRIPCRVSPRGFAAWR